MAILVSLNFETPLLTMVWRPDLFFPSAFIPFSSFLFSFILFYFSSFPPCPPSHLKNGEVGHERNTFFTHLNRVYLAFKIGSVFACGFRIGSADQDHSLSMSRLSTKDITLVKFMYLVFTGREFNMYLAFTQRMYLSWSLCTLYLHR